MNIQIYCGKKNFDAQKAERYFKERRIPFQALDLKKHKLGEREIRMMISAIGIEKLIDRDDKNRNPGESLADPGTHCTERQQDDDRIPAGYLGTMGIRRTDNEDSRTSENDAAGLSRQGCMYCIFRGLRNALPFLP